MWWPVKKMDKGRGGGDRARWTDMSNREEVKSIGCSGYGKGHSQKKEEAGTTFS